MELAIAQNYCEELLKKHRLDLIGWKFGKFDSAVRRMGVCRGRKKVIDLSKKMTLLRPDDEVRNTIIHEVAHAIDNATRGHSGHDEVWRNIFISIGGNGLTHSSTSEEVCMKTYKYLAICPIHGQISGFIRKPSHTDGWICRKCKSKLTVVLNEKREVC
jgi:predicted SprT family Zn-dependent metalloprotease